jgi:oligosaccharide repeat unit polymerase
VAIALAVVLSVFACLAIVRLPAMHPAQLWLIPWALATIFFAAHLLPYRTIQLRTVVIIVGCAGTFVAGSLIGERVLARQIAPNPESERLNGAPLQVSLAARLVLVALVLTCSVFVLQLVKDFGVRSALISSGQVRLAIGAGGLSLTIKYIYFAFAAVSLSTIMAGAARQSATRNRWLAAAVGSGLSLYFTTARSDMIVALVIGLLTWGVARPDTVTRARLLLTLGALIVLALLIFTVGGAIIGKTLTSNELSTINSPFTRDSALTDLALPYEYLSAPIAGLQREVALSSTWGRDDGCATLHVVCQILRKAGLNVHPEPAIRAETRAPLSWNAYTSLDFLLIDGGFVWVAPMTLVLGLLMGALWAGARKGRVRLVALYAIFGSTLLLSAYQNSFFAPHIVGSAIICLLAIASGGWLVARHEYAIDNGDPGAIRSS